MKSALELTVTSKLDENYFVEQELDEVKRLLNVCGVFAGVRHDDLKSRSWVDEKGAGGTVMRWIGAVPWYEDTAIQLGWPRGDGWGQAQEELCILRAQSSAARHWSRLHGTGRGNNPAAQPTMRSNRATAHRKVGHEWVLPQVCVELPVPCPGWHG